MAIDIAPEVGCRFVSFRDIRSGYEFLWRNSNLPLGREAVGTEYDANFFGGIDELLPNDIPEDVGGVAFPDHGELWTSEFEHHQIDDSSVDLEVYLPLCRIRLRRSIVLEGRVCSVTSAVTNCGKEARAFLWKLHVALRIQPGDLIECPAARYMAADADWSRRSGEGVWNGETIPTFDGSTEFLYLKGLQEGRMGWRRGGKRFEVLFNARVFRFPWYFASYGGFDGHHVAILEPCTCMPISVNSAAALGQCSVLEPSETLSTAYSYAGWVDED